MSVADVLSRLASKRDSMNMKLTDPKSLCVVKEWVSTGCLPLDIIMGGGIPVGRVTEIYGDNSTGKSLLGAHILAQTQQVDGVAVLYDTETTTSPDVMAAVGVNLDELIYSTPDIIEDVFDNLLAVIQARDEVAPDSLLTIVWDSVASTSSEAEMEKIKKEGLRGHTVATHARQLSTMFRVITRMISQKRIAVVLVNQTREKIGVMFGDTTSTFGGKSIGFHSSIRLELAHVRTLKNGAAPCGIEIRARVSKNKIAPPFGTCNIPIMFNTGIDEAGAILWQLKANKTITMLGAWMKLELPEIGTIKFQTPTWAQTYLEHQQAIRQLLALQSGIYEVEDGYTGG